MPRFKYYPPFRLTYQYDCHFFITARSLNDALAIARLKSPHTLICVYADAVFEGRHAHADVSLYTHQTEGKTDDEIMEMFDAKVDDYIARRVKINTWKDQELI